MYISTLYVGDMCLYVFVFISDVNTSFGNYSRVSNNRGLKYRRRD